MESLFLKVLNMSATASVVILGVLLARRLLHRAPKVFSYALWAVVLFRLLCPVTFESVFALAPNIQIGPHEPVVHTVAETAPPQGETAVSLGSAPAYVPGTPAPAETGSPAVLAEPPAVVPEAPGGDEAAPAAAPGPWTVASAVWLAGAALLLGYSLVSLLRLRSWLAGSVPLAGEKNVRQADHIPSPFVLGIVRPKIYLPFGLPEQERGYILLHERTHIRRGDHIFRALAWLALAAHWFNPLVWLAFHLAGQDMEMSCDEAVLRKMGPEIRADYSTSLLRLATGKRLPAGPLAFGEGDTGDRIKNVLSYKKPALWVVTAAFAAVVCAGAALATDPYDFIDPDSVTAATSFRASLYTINELGYGVYTPEDLQKDLEIRTGASTLSQEDSAELIRLLNLYRRWVYGHGGLTLDGGDHHFTRIDCVDGSFYLVDHWYWNGFSLNPLHMGEDSYTTLVTYFDAQGSAGTTWQMEYNFDRAYDEWYSGIQEQDQTPQPPSSEEPAPSAGLTFQTDEGSGAVWIQGRVDGVSLEPGTVWTPPLVSRQLGELLMAYPPFDGSMGQGWLRAWWTDKTRTTVALSTSPMAEVCYDEPAGYWEFTVELSDGGTVTEMTPCVIDWGDEAEQQLLPETVPDGEAVKAARLAAALLTAVEGYYDSSVPPVEPQPVDLSALDGLTCSDGWGSTVNLEGLDAREMRWYSPSEHAQGQLHFTDPACFGPAFAGRQIQGYTAWADDDHTELGGYLSVEGNSYLYFTVEMDKGRVAPSFAGFGISAEEMMAMAQTCAVLMERAEAYKTSDDYRPAEDGPLPFDRPMELEFSSGAGAWRTAILLHPDGSFQGDYYDADMATEYVCQFHGQFGDIARATDTSWSLTLKELVLDTKYPVGQEWDEGAIHYISSAPYGFSKRDGAALEPGAQFTLYTPDAKGYAPTDDLYGASSDNKDYDSILYQFWSWQPSGHTIGRWGPDTTLGRYGLCSMETGFGFFS